MDQDYWRIQLENGMTVGQYIKIHEKFLEQTNIPPEARNLAEESLDRARKQPLFATLRIAHDREKALLFHGWKLSVGGKIESGK